MHFINAIAATLLVGGAAAFTLPANLRDGVYSVHYDEKDGREVHERLSSDAAPDSVARSATPSADISLAERQAYEFGSKIYCGCGWGLDHGNCDAAVADIQNQMNAHGCVVASGQSIYSIRGNVVAFACNTGAHGDANYCGSDFGGAMAAVTQACGWYIAGTFSEDFSEDGVWWNAYLNVGYMQYYGGEDFCGAALSSGVSSC